MAEFNRSFLDSMLIFLYAEDWTRDAADEDEEGAEEEEEAGSASSLSEVAQVDDVNQSQGRTK